MPKRANADSAMAAVLRDRQIETRATAIPVSQTASDDVRRVGVACRR